MPWALYERQTACQCCKLDLEVHFRRLSLRAVQEHDIRVEQLPKDVHLSRMKTRDERAAARIAQPFIPCICPFIVQIIDRRSMQMSIECAFVFREEQCSAIASRHT